MAKRNQQNAISLFPFLAVLVCTMGALILLLLVTTRRMRNDVDAPLAEHHANAGGWGDSASGGDSAAPLWVELDADENAQVDDFAMSEAGEQQKERPDNSKTTEDPNPFSISLLPPTVEPDSRQLAKKAEMEDLQKLLQEEGVRHDFLLKQIEDAKLQLEGGDPDSNRYQIQLHELTTLRQQEEILNQELKNKQALLVDLQTELEQYAKQTEQGEQVLRRRESALISLREITKQKQESAAAGTAETILDFTNRTGTSRTPIVVEVSEAGFEFLPAHIKLTPQEMRGFPANDNPLLAGIFAIHETRNPSTLSSKPYVLLLVRSSGSMMFYAAQRTLSDAGIHFGYELVDEERRISAGSESAEETRVVRQSVLAALGRRSELYGGLAATLDTMRKPASDENPRRMSVLPDGSIASAEELTSGWDGQYYAGGVAPPRKATDAFERLAESTDSPKQSKESSDDFPAIAGNPFAHKRHAETQAAPEVASQENPWKLGGQFAQSPEDKASGAVADPNPFSTDNGFPELVNAAPAPANLAASADSFDFPTPNDASGGNVGSGNPAADDQPAHATPNSEPLMADSGWKPGVWKNAWEPVQITPSTANESNGADASQTALDAFTHSQNQPPIAGSTVDLEAPVAAAAPKAVQLFPRHGLLSGNLGAGSRSTMNGLDVPHTAADTAAQDIVANDTPAAPPEFRLFGDPQPAKTPNTKVPETNQTNRSFVDTSPWSPIMRQQDADTDEENTKTQTADRTSSLDRSGWPAWGTAPSGTATRTAGAAENSFADASNTSVFGPSETRTANPEGAASAGGIIGSGEPPTEVSFLQKFMQSVELQKESQKPDSFLLALMQQGQKQQPTDTAKPSTAPSTETRDTTPAGQQTPAAKPAARNLQTDPPESVKTQPTAPQRYARHRVEIILEKKQLTIGDFEPVDTTGWDEEQILAMVMHGISTELELEAEAGNEGVAPAVEFIVADGMAPVQKMLMRELSGVDIPTRSVKPLRSSQGSPQTTTGPMPGGAARNEVTPKAATREPAEPAKPSEHKRSGSGLSI